MVPAFQYTSANTSLHRLDPRTKILLLLASFVLALVFIHPAFAGAVLLLLLGQATWARGLHNLWRIRLLFFFIALFSILIWAFAAQGTTPLWWRVSKESLLYGLGTAIRIDATIVAGLIFLSTTTNEEVLMGLVGLKIPHTAAFTFATALRLLPTVITTASQVVEAQRSRGLDLEAGGPIKRLHAYFPLLGPIFLTTLRNADILALALESKAFRAFPQRTFYRASSLQPRDGAALALAAALLAFALALRLAGYGLISGLLRT